MLRPFWAILRRLGFNLGHLERILPQRGAQDHQKGALTIVFVAFQDPAEGFTYVQTPQDGWR